MLIKEFHDIMKVINALADFGVVLKCVTKKFEKETKR